MHEWEVAEFHWGSHFICTCGYEPKNQAEMDGHNALTIQQTPNERERNA